MTSDVIKGLFPFSEGGRGKGEGIATIVILSHAFLSDQKSNFISSLSGDTKSVSLSNIERISFPTANQH